MKPSNRRKIKNKLLRWAFQEDYVHTEICWWKDLPYALIGVGIWCLMMWLVCAGW